MRNRAFTLIELLVVLAIVSILAGVLMPVFRAAKATASRTVCASNMRQAHLASALYWADYDDVVMPMNHRPGESGNSSNDRTWVQLLLPYLRSFSVFTCPSDTGLRPRPESTFDQDLVPGDTDSRYYSASMRSNIGFNYVYLAPVQRVGGGPWFAMTRHLSSITTSSDTLLFVDSVWDRDEHGQPVGGGNWLVAPPCRYVRVGGRRLDTFVSLAGGQLYLPDNQASGWKPGNLNHAALYGGAWPWHDGRMNTVMIDGSARSVVPRRLAAGCDLKDSWAGTIMDFSQYSWDVN